MKKVLCMMPDGFEDIELVMIVDLLRRAKVQADLCSIDEYKVVSQSNIQYKSDLLLIDVEIDNYDMIFLPGGRGHRVLKENESVLSLIVEFHKKEKLLSAICAAPSIFGELGLLKGKRYSCYPSFEKQDFNGKYIKLSNQKDGNVLTSCGIGKAHEFGLMLITELLGEDVSSQIKQSTLY